MVRLRLLLGHLLLGDLRDAAGDGIELHQGFDAAPLFLEGGELASRKTKKIKLINNTTPKPPNKNTNPPNNTKISYINPNKSIINKKKLII